MNTNAQSNSYDALWKELNAEVKDFKPINALSVVDKISKKAQKEDNFNQYVKAQFCKFSLKSEIDPDSVADEMKVMDSLLLVRKDPVEQAVLKVLIASLYDTYNSDFYYRDEDAKETAMKLQKKYLEEALADKYALMKASTKDYLPLTKSTVDSKLFFNNDMLSLIASVVASYDDMSAVNVLTEVRDFYISHGKSLSASLIDLKILSLDINYSDKIYNGEPVTPHQKERKDNLVKSVERLKEYMNSSDKEIKSDAYVLYYEKVVEESDMPNDERYNFVEKALGITEKSVRHHYFESKKMELEVPSLYLNLSEPYPDEPFNITVSGKNVDKVNVSVYELACDKWKLFDLESENEMMKAKGNLVWSGDVSLNAGVMQLTDTITTSLPLGKYLFVASCKSERSVRMVEVASLQLALLNFKDDKIFLHVMDRRSGKPVNGCKIDVRCKKSYYSDDKEILKTVVSDNMGRAVLEVPEIDVIYYECLAGIDDINEALKCKFSCYGYHDNTVVNSRVKYNLYTDRAIYRPGQEVHVNAIVYKQYKDKVSVLPSQKVTLCLVDVNSKEVDTLTALTNEFGSCSVTFKIPADRLLGNYYIYACDNEEIENRLGYVSFKVEEYKRPTFFCEFDSYDKSYSFGDTITASGKATLYSGANLQNANVNYRIEYATSTFYSYFFSRNWKKLSTGTTTTDEDGRFEVPVFLDDKMLDEFSYGDVAFFRVVADITSLSGETRSAEFQVSVSYCDFSLSFDCPDVLCKEKQPKVTVNAINRKGKQQDVSGTWKLYRCVSGLSKDKGDTIVIDSGTFASGEPLRIDFSSLPNADKYCIEAEATDSKGNKIRKSSSLFTVFSTEDTEINVEDNFFYAENGSTFGPGKPFGLYYALPHDAYMFSYKVSASGNVQYGVENVDNSLHKISIDYKDEYGDCLSLILFYLKDGKVYEKKYDVTLVRPEKKLDLEWSTFRDKLHPGQEEEWILTLKDKDGKTVSAELMSTLYDGSLDYFVRHGWGLGLNFSRSIPRVYIDYRQTKNISFYFSFRGKEIKKIENRVFDSFDCSFIDEYGGDNGYYDILEFFSKYNLTFENGVLERRQLLFSAREGAHIKLAASAGSIEESFAPDAKVMNEKMSMTDEASVEELGKEENQTQEKFDDSKVVFRENFNETAFFMPNLITDKNGCVKIKFTLPESLTTWNFIGLAHTKNMDYGNISAQVKASKEFVIQPNMPRFLRVGDNAVISALVINQAEKKVDGRVMMKIYDAETEQLLLTKTDMFDVDANGTTSVSFAVPSVFSDAKSGKETYYPTLICEIMAVSEEFSDGERNMLPVIDSREHILETVPFWLEKGKKEVDLKGLFNSNSKSATDRKITIDYTDSPAWTVVQAISTVKEPYENNAIDYAASLYSNQIASLFAERIPHLREVVDAWKRDGNLKSPLMENENLKNIALKETPWLFYAENETERREQLTELFDSELMNNRINTAIEKLADLQMADGGWTWFKGMESSIWVTMSVVENMAYLDRLGQLPDKARKMMVRGLDWLDGIVYALYTERLKYSNNPQPSELDCHYMFASAVTNHKGSDKVEKMKSHYLDCIEKINSNFTIYGWSNFAILLDACGRHAAGKKFVESVRQYSVLTPGQGRHFNTERAQYSWRDYKLPTHIAAMNAMNAYAADYDDYKVYFNDMLTWLIRQKQTQGWDNPLNTVDAVNVILLHDNPEEVLHEPQKPEVWINKTTVDLGKMTEGVGYFNKQVEDDVVEREFKAGTDLPVLTVEKTSPGVSWGAVYAQFVETADRLKDYGKELTVTRRYLIENDNNEFVTLDTEDTADGLTKITAPLRVGQKVTVRLTVKADHDMDFVSLRCQTAACFEPLIQTSGFRWSKSQGYYQAVHDSSADFFFGVFRKGTCTIDLPLVVAREGEYLDGLATVQCQYSPDFAGHSAGGRVKVTK